MAFRHVGVSVFAVAAVAGVPPGIGASARPPSAGATIVLASSFDQTVVDKPPVGPSVGDIEHDDGQLRDDAGRLMGTLHVTCVLTRMLAGGDALERCTGTASTTDGSVRLSGVGRLIPPNPPWQVTGLSGRYAGLQGRLTYDMAIPLGETPPGLIPAGPFDSVNVVEFPAARHLRAGVVPRPAVNTPFISRANSRCNATQAAADETAQVHAALADNPVAFVRAVRQAGPADNKLVLASAVLGVQACTFG